MAIRIGTAAALAAGALAAAGAPASAENYGRALETHEVVTTTIAPAGDADDFVFHGAAGFRLSVSAKRAKGTDLAPVLELLAPDGSPVVAGMKAVAGKSSAKLSGVLPSDGKFALRLRGSSGTGACTLKWKLLPAKVPAARKVPLAPDSLTEFPFQARGGALLSWTLSFKGDGSVVVEEVVAPDGTLVPFDPSDPVLVLRKAFSEKVKNLPIPAHLPGGTYRLRVTNELFASTANLSVRVVLPKLPALAVALTPLEPILASIDRFSGTCGSPAVLEGSNLSESPRGIRFGGKAATAVAVTGGDGAVPHDGTTASCRVPAGTGTVDVLLENADGQVAVLLGVFGFDPLPTLTGFDPTVGPGQGGTDLTLRGSGFQTEVGGIYEVLVGGVPAVDVRVLDATTITCRTPAHVAGPKQVILRDMCGTETAAPGTFSYGTGLFITTIRPAAVPIFGNMAVTVSGSNFSAGDTVFLDGNAVPTSPVVYGTTVIGHRVAPADLPPHAPGKVDVRVQSPGGATSTKAGGLEYFTFTDATAASVPAATAADDWGGVSNAVVDSDNDGKVDLILVTHDAALSATRPGTRVLRNGGTGAFTDVTSTAMPEVQGTEDWAGNAILSGRLNSDTIPDVFLSRPGTGVAFDSDGDGSADWDEARLLTGNKFVDPWVRLLFLDSGGKYSPPSALSGPGGALGISGLLLCNATWACAGEKRPSVCRVFDFDFRSTNATMGDLDGDLDQDVVLVNDRSLATFTGLSVGVWVSCYGYKYVDYQYYSVTPFGSAMRILSSGSTGGLTDRTKDLMETLPTAEEDFRAVAAAVADVNGDFLNDILITWNQGITKGAASVPATRLFRQKNTGSTVLYKQDPNFLPAVPSAASDDWRGDAVAAADLDADFYRDVVISLDGALPSGGALSTRVLIHDPVAARAFDRTAQVLGGVLPAGDDGRAKVLLARDVDRDGDIDLVLGTPASLGANRSTRLLLNLGRDESTGYPGFLDASSLLPPVADDPGTAVAISLGDVDGDGHLDFVVTDTRQTGGTPARRTRVWRQVR
jgi:hypothetical protein